jgi:hypothetical protein
MSLHDRRRMDPGLARAYALPVVREISRRRSQRELVAWSLLVRPDHHPPGD